MAYEEARQLRLQENRKRMEELRIPQISKALTKISGAAKRPQRRTLRLGDQTLSAAEPRRSSRIRNRIPSYRDDLELDIDLPRTLRRSRSNSSWASYIARPLHECKTASYEERAQAFKVAEEFQSHLPSAYPSFVKSMVRSHVYSCFWLTVEMVLEDEKGKEYDATYIGKRTGLSGGWRGFALEHKLDDGDALVFQLVEPNRFKVYMFRVSSLERHGNDATRAAEREDFANRAKKRARATKFVEQSQPKPTQSKEQKKDDDSAKTKQAEAGGDNIAGGSEPRNRASARLLRKRA